MRGINLEEHVDVLNAFLNSISDEDLYEDFKAFCNKNKKQAEFSFAFTENDGLYVWDYYNLGDDDSYHIYNNQMKEAA